MTQMDTWMQTAGVPWMKQVHGEIIRYRSSGSDPDQITAVEILREEMQTPGGVDLPRYPAIITVSKEDVPRLTIGGDRVIFRRRPHDTSDTELVVTELLEELPGMWVLGCK